MTMDKKPKKLSKTERLAKNLKANLVRRKVQDRKRSETETQKEENEK